MPPLLFMQRSIIGWNALNPKNNALLTVHFLNLINRDFRFISNDFRIKISDLALKYVAYA